MRPLGVPARQLHGGRLHAAPRAAPHLRREPGGAAGGAVGEGEAQPCRS